MSYRERHPNPPIGDGRYGSVQGFTRRTKLPPPTVLPPPQPRPRAGKTRIPNIAVIVCVYQEELIVPFFLRHYWFADRIIALVGKSSDRSEELLRADKRVEVRDLTFPGNKFNDRLKAEAMNRAAGDLAGYDWVIAADVDEFVWPEGDPAGNTLKSFLSRVHPLINVVRVKLLNVYRHRHDSDLRIESGTPPVMQRRHGVPHPLPGYIKPSFIRPASGVRWELGHHDVTQPRRFAPFHLMGSHWAKADPSWAAKRTIEGRLERLSEENLRNNWGNGVYGQSAQKVRDELASHLDDPLVVL